MREPEDLKRDVAVIGGVAVANFAPVSFREDYNISIVLVEPRPPLGGHVSTCLVPEANATV
ncbi:MAG: hypothetical protein EOO38_24715 [Cytophagaceae bacterium]|nr:MAG: hypothetical protein EOO38_24715 [Cytophagaceae bacterium]